MAFGQKFCGRSQKVINNDNAIHARAHSGERGRNNVASHWKKKPKNSSDLTLIAKTQMTHKVFPKIFQD